MRTEGTSQSPLVAQLPPFKGSVVVKMTLQSSFASILQTLASPPPLTDGPSLPANRLIFTYLLGFQPVR